MTDIFNSKTPDDLDSIPYQTYEAADNKMMFMYGYNKGVAAALDDSIESSAESLMDQIDQYGEDYGYGYSSGYYSVTFAN